MTILNLILALDIDLTYVTRKLAFVIFGIAAAVSLLSFRRPQLAELRYLSLLWCTLFALDIGGQYQADQNLHNHWLYNIYNWIFYFGVAVLFHQQLLGPFLKTIIKVFVIVFPFFVLIDSLYLEGVFLLQSYVIIFGGSFIIFLSAAYLHQLYLSNETQRITNDPWFWFSVAFIVYFGVAIPYLGMLRNTLEQYPEFTKLYYFLVYIFFTMALHLLMIKGFLCRLNYQNSPR